MTRTRTIRSILAALVVVVVFTAVIGLAGADRSSAGQAAVIRAPRPHPASHLAEMPESIEVEGIARRPRPHPQSHLEILSTQSR